MDGLGMNLAAMSIGLSQSDTASQVSLALLKNTMDSQEAAGARIIEDLSEMAPPADGRGALLDIRA